MHLSSLFSDAVLIRRLYSRFLINFVLQPAEMILEEIENKLGSLIQVDTISQLKSAVWKERLEGLYL